MKISVICSSREHPIYPLLVEWQRCHSTSHQVELVNSTAELTGGDLLLLISCGEIIDGNVRSRYRKTLVIHASNLPEGRGWSPHIWQILEGRNSFTVTLLDAEDVVDSGAIWAQRQFTLEGHELYDEINARLFRCELELMDFAVGNFESVLPRPQHGTPSYYPRRTVDDSRIDPDRPLAEQFDLLRVADPHRFPAFFELRGQCYKLTIAKADREEILPHEEE